ncbi:MAG: hypothetical protein SYC29_01085 [Planctomycetota bacterium]|nr:hypothetical protein [Planctomycetota bacterium]
MPTSETKRRLAAAGMFVLPLVLVKATAMFLGGTGPAEVAAAPTPAMPAVTPPPIEPAREIAGARTDGQQQAAEHIARLHAEDFGSTPLYYQSRDEEAEVVFEHPDLPPPPEFILQAVLASSSGNTALIDGEALRVGDRLGDTDWQLIEIDVEARTVTVLDPRTERTEKRSVRGLP